MSFALPANISISKAALPQTYERAKTALAECSRIDECQDWADKAEALASYAKQADDDSLRKLADRIQARAVRRCGELLKQFDARGGDRKSPEIKTVGTVSFDQTQKQAARDAGLTERQQVAATAAATHTVRLGFRRHGRRLKVG